MTVGTIDPAIMQLSGTVPTVVEDALLATTKALALTVPAPRDDPYYGIDRSGGPSLRSLHRLSRHGDFRKYVFVLDAGAGLGGAARWLALRFGCRVAGLDVSPVRAGLITRLSRRVGLGERVWGMAGRLEAVPCRDGTFTQVWTVEALHRVADRRRAIGELYRVLRPGSPLAMQEIVRDANDDAAAGGTPTRPGTVPEYLEALRAAGFGGVEVDDVTDGREESSPIVLSARARFAQELAKRHPPDTRGAPTRAAAAPAAGHRVVQLFARRPSV